ncbi:hypothetical protein [Pseudobutyrivibrio sp.]|jgi:hypothetical protein|uniref:hypothetical protein n=1 Tax=Pseudobutyrivibrio sp. TaxID=2014367 RepID=UPI0025F093AC|nr:hypothetical protein [Pseudobutyrivibrio sp.]
MQKCKGVIYPRILEEVVNYAELQQVWDCSYVTAYRILHGLGATNHIRKKQLADYLGVPVDELWVKNPNVDPQKATPSTDNSETISESDKGV